MYIIDTPDAGFKDEIFDFLNTAGFMDIWPRAQIVSGHSRGVSSIRSASSVVSAYSTGYSA